MELKEVSHTFEKKGQWIELTDVSYIESATFGYTSLT